MMKWITLIIVLSIFSCVDNEEKSTDYSDCLQKTPDYDLLLRAPFQYKSSNGTWDSNSVSLVLMVDSIQEPYKFQHFASPPPSGMGSDQDGKDYFLIQRTAFTVCNIQFDTCYLSGAEIRSDGFVGYNELYHKDTTGWGGYDWFSSMGQSFQCQLDTNGGMIFQEPSNESFFHFVSNMSLLDTVSDPAYRSIYQQWWPLPRKPWPKGESVIADSTIWADSVADSLEVWTYPWYSEGYGVFISKP